MTALYDSIDPTKIPATAPIVAGYVGGNLGRVDAVVEGGHRYQPMAIQLT